MNSQRQIEIIEEIKDLGFHMMADSLIEDNPTKADIVYYQQDIEKARRESTEEEFPINEYYKIHELIAEYFENYLKEHHSMKISKNQLKKIIREEKIKLLAETNSSGLYSPREDEQEEDLLAEIEHKIDLLVDLIRERSIEIGGSFRGPGIRYRAFQLLSQKIPNR